MATVLSRAGSVAFLAGSSLLLMSAPSPSTASAMAATSSCAAQPNLDYPTDSTRQLLTRYWFEVEHSGRSQALCDLKGAVQSGDRVTVHFTLVTAAGRQWQLSLVSYTSPSGGATLADQAIHQCATLGSEASTQEGTAGCVAGSGDQTMTIMVPVCGFQVDFVYGTAISNFGHTTYHATRRYIASDNHAGPDACSGNAPSTAAVTTPPAAPTSAPTASATPSPSIAPASSPSGTASPTPTPTIASTATPTATATATPTATPTPVSPSATAKPSPAPDDTSVR